MAMHGCQWNCLTGVHRGFTVQIMTHNTLQKQSKSFSWQRNRIFFSQPPYLNPDEHDFHLLTRQNRRQKQAINGGYSKCEKVKVWKLLILRFTVVLVCPVTFEPLQIGDNV